ncbi:MAG TPA: YbhB/YbcL family Raf kinase inhibitor-like protein [Candidatus Methanofastidiosa archaeon]|nr:YbhB/YbcL family Raf kinase inhibitor-like protein [Candidatus Methanofastidiosa archaeon]HPR42144.1 YbhB/YbcL family Raf kinase inhibitor-like protein [Candidatus Methanofastidiosa archaeon]
MKITSEAFENGEDIPSKYTCQGADINPPLSIDGIPEGTTSLAVIMEDPDAPVGIWDHWIVWNIHPTSTIAEGSVPGIQGLNDFIQAKYGGPCPPSGIHRYFFKVFALDTYLDLKEGAKKEELLAAMDGHVLDKAELMGKYKRK